jgi:hypothetical protein
MDKKWLLHGPGRAAIREGVGAWVATKAALKTFLAANDGANNPHSVPVMASPPTVTAMATGGSASAPAAPYTGLTSAYRFAAGTIANVMLTEGGGSVAYATDNRRFPVATRGVSGGNVSTTEDATWWRGRVRTNALAIAFRVAGTPSTPGHRFIVDGEYVSLTPTVPLAGGGRNYYVLEFGSSAFRTIEIEGGYALSIDGIHVAPGDTVTLPSSPTFRGIVFGDSFTTTTGAAHVGDGFVPVLRDYLGVELWASGVGGSGYVNTQTGTVYKLSERIGADLDRFIATNGAPPSLVVAPIGINDIGLSGIQAEAEACFAIIRQKCPAAVVLVTTGPWDVNAPSAPVTNYSACKSAIQSAIGSRGGFYALDMEGVSYTKADSTHPNTAGHLTLGQSLNTKIRAAIAA